MMELDRRRWLLLFNQRRDYENTILLLRYCSLSYLAAAEKKVALEVEPVRLRWYIMRVLE